MSSPGVRPASSMARTRHSSASSFASNAGQWPPSSATPCRRPAAAIRAPAARYTSAVHSSASAKVDAPTGITMKSWMSTRRPAWAPPPKIWISGSGSRAGASPRRWRHSGRPAAAAAACSPAIETAMSALPPRRLRSSVPSRLISVRSRAAWAVTPRPRRAGCDLLVDVAHRGQYVVPAEARAAVPQIERLAPAGRGSGRGHGAPAGAACQTDLGLDGRAAARVPHPAGRDALDHGR